MRNQNWKIFIASLFTIFFITLLSGCAAGNAKTIDTKTDTDKKQGGEVDVAISAEPSTLDWMYTGASVTRDIGWHIFEPLLALDQGYEVRPMIAEDFQISEDGKTYTFTIRDNVTFHHGGTVGMKDVLASFKRWQKVSSVGQTASKYIQDVKEIDETTFEITLSEAYGSLLTDLAAPKSSFIILPAEIAEAAGENPLDENQLIGTGPYKMEQWVRGQEIVLKRFEDYSSRAEEDWGGLTGKKTAYIDSIHFKIVKDAQVMLNGVKTGLYDYAQNIPPDLYDVVENNSSIETIIFINGYSTLTPDKSEAPFDDLKVRQAINYGLDKEAIAKAVYGNEQFYELDGALFAPEQEVLYSNQGTEEYLAYNPKKAKKLLAESSYNGESLKLIYASDYDQYASISEIVKEQLGKIGIEVELIAYDWATFLEKWGDNQNWDLETVGWSTRFSPNELGMLVLGTSSSGWYESDRWQKLMNKWNLAKTNDERKEILTEMNQTVYEELPFIIIANVSTLDIKATHLKEENHWVGQRFWNSWLEDN